MNNTHHLKKAGHSQIFFCSIHSPIFSAGWLPPVKTNERPLKTDGTGRWLLPWWRETLALGKLVSSTAMATSYSALDAHSTWVSIEDLVGGRKVLGFGRLRRLEKKYEEVAKVGTEVRRLGKWYRYTSSIMHHWDGEVSTRKVHLFPLSYDYGKGMWICTSPP